MRMSVKDLNATLVILGLALFAVVYFLLYVPVVDETDMLIKETEKLKGRAEELVQHKNKEQEYRAAIEQNEEAIRREIESYPTHVMEENMLLFVVDMEKDYDMSFETVSFSEPVGVHSFQTPQGEEQRELTVYGVDFTLNGSFGYSHLKDFLRSLPEETERTALNQVSMTYNAETGALSGSMSIKKYFMTDGTEPYIAPLIPDIRYGVRDLFGSLS